MPIKLKFASQLLALIDGFLFPKKCLFCKESIPIAVKEPVCPKCYEKFLFFEYLNLELCQICSAPLLSASKKEPVCSWCLAERPFFDGSRCVFSYTDPVRNLIHQLKFNKHYALAVFLGDFMAKAVLDLPKMDALVAVPLDPLGLFKRGYNQAFLLAKPIAKRLQLKIYSDVLLKVRSTAAQVGLSREQRLINVKGAFAVPRKKKIQDKKILLVDDVMTTGSTASECSKTLKEAGAAEVYLLTLARAVFIPPAEPPLEHNHHDEKEILELL